MPLQSVKPWVSQVPVAALVAIMVMVSIDTFDWSSVRALVVHPRLSSMVMVATVIVTVFTANLALGVAVGAAVGITVVLLLILVQVLQMVGDRLVVHFSRK